MTYTQNMTGLYLPSDYADGESRASRPVMREIATTRDGRDITRGFVDINQLQPSSDEILRFRGNNNYRIYRETLRDDQVTAMLQQRRLAITSKETKVEPGGTTRRDQAAADMIREYLNNIGWDRITGMMHYGIYYGFGVAEAMWTRDGRNIALDAIKVRNRERFGFDGGMRLRMKTYSRPEGELLPPRKFWSFCTGADHDDEPYGLGLAHWVYWPVLFKRNGLKFWLIFLEKFGQPTSMGKYPANALPAERAKLLQALAAITTDAGIAVPQGMEIELLEAARSGTADYVQLVNKMDAAIAKVVIGQTASSEGTPGRLGNDELQGDVRDDLVKADADLLCESFNRTIVRWLTEWNYPGAAIPRVYREVEPPEDTSEKATRDSTIVGMGFKPTLGYIQENYGDGWEENPVATPMPPQSSTGSRTENASFAESQAQPPEQMIDRTADTLAPATTRWIDSVRGLLDEVSSLDELRDRLLEIYPDLTLDQYADALAQATATARLAGRNEVVEERNA